MADPAQTAPTTNGAHKAPFHVAIVGGGIGGLCLAIGLAKQGVSFHLYEAAPAFAEIGAGVAFNVMAQHAMELIDPRIGEGFRRQATYNADFKDTYFQFRHGQDAPEDADANVATGDSSGSPSARNHFAAGTVTGKRKKRAAGELFMALTGPKYGICSTHRAHFLDELIKLLPTEYVSFGHKVTRIDDSSEGHVMLHFAHVGSVPARADAVIGCDGIKSAVRDSLLGPEYRARFSGKYAYRGLLDMQRAADLLGDKIARNSQIHSGYGGHILHMPVEHGATLNVVAFRTKADNEWKDERWVLPMDRKDMERDFVGWGKPVQNILSLLEKPDVWALFDHPPAPTFVKNRVALMGDAAHASTPHQGSGAGFAIADAYLLSNILSHVRSADQIPAAFDAYDQVRRPPALKLVTTSREQGRIFQFQGDGIGDDEDAFDQNMHQRLHWILGMDMEEEAKKTRDLFAKATNA